MTVSFDKLSDEELIFETREAIRIETEATSQVVRLFREIESRELYLLKGYSSLFTFAVEGLGYCAGSAQLRINAMRLIDSVPEVERQLESGELSLTAASKIQTFFKAEEKSNKVYSQGERAAVVQDCLKKSTREVERELARKNPDILIYETTKPVGEDRFQLTFTITRELEAKIRKLKGLLAHSKPNLSNEELLEVLVKLGSEKFDPVEKAERAARRIAKRPRDRNVFSNASREGSRSVECICENDESKPLDDSGIGFPLSRISQSGHPPVDEALFHAHETRSGGSSVGRSRYISAIVRNEVWLRNRGDGCEYVDSKSGRRCCSQQALQIDHIKEFSMSGEHSPENLRILCAKHNRFAFHRASQIQRVRERSAFYIAG